MLELGHRPLELARAMRPEHERVGPEIARVLRVVADECVHEAACRLRHASGRVLLAVVAGALAAAHEGVEGGKDVEGDEERAALEELAVVHPLPRGQRVLELPGAADGGIVVRAARPPRARPAGDGFPQAGHALGKTIEGRAEPDVVDEGERLSLVPDAESSRP